MGGSCCGERGQGTRPLGTSSRVTIVVAEQFTVHRLRDLGFSLLKRASSAVETPHVAVLWNWIPRCAGDLEICWERPNDMPWMLLYDDELLTSMWSSGQRAAAWRSILFSFRMKTFP